MRLTRPFALTLSCPCLPLGGAGLAGQVALWEHKVADAIWKEAVGFLRGQIQTEQNPWIRVT